MKAVDTDRYVFDKTITLDAVLMELLTKLVLMTAVRFAKYRHFPKTLELLSKFQIKEV
jgi:hypothetical protein